MAAVMMAVVAVVAAVVSGFGSSGDEKMVPIVFKESSKPVQDNDNSDQELEKEEEGECPFCAYMKGGECRETFINWEKCIENNGDEDIVEKCFEVTSALSKCMEANQDYYAPILQAEKRAEQKVLNQLEQEKAKEAENAKDANEDKVKQETS
nr:GCK-like protein [Tanacetum cinerariifolium]